MTTARVLAIGFIFFCTAVAWSILGGSVVARTGESDRQLANEVAKLWGGEHQQHAPTAKYTVPTEREEQVEVPDAAGKLVKVVRQQVVALDYEVPLVSSRVNVRLDVDHRRKGLLWYPTYAVAFAGQYLFRNPDSVARVVTAQLPFPAQEGLYDGFTLRFEGAEGTAVTDLSRGATASVELPPGGEGRLHVAYRSRGLGTWTYALAGGVGQVRDFELQLATNVERIDFPAGTLSPTTKARAGAGWELRWAFESLVTGQRIGVELPNKLNPGPLAARITFFAPVGLLFFLTVMVLMGALTRQNLHPMNYFFLSAAFFAFHLLLAYLVDHVDIHAAFAVSSAVSVFLVVSYLRLVAGARFAFLRAGLAQLVFLVLFSYAFFFEGYTGLTVTVGAILTLFALMQLTARVDWNEVFAGRSAGGEVAR